MLAAAPTDVTVQPRKNFLSCLNAAMRDKLSAKAKPEEFDGAIGTACAAQQAAYRNAMVSMDVGMGIDRKAAEKNADDDIGIELDNAKDMYRQYSEAGAMPAPR